MRRRVMTVVYRLLIKLCLSLLIKPLRIHLHTPEMLKMLNYGITIQFPYEIQHKLVELFGAKTILIVVYATDKLSAMYNYTQMFDVVDCERNGAFGPSTVWVPKIE